MHPTHKYKLFRNSLRSSQIQAIVKEADVNKDGSISLDEFLTMAEKHPELKLTGKGFWGRLF